MTVHRGLYVPINVVGASNIGTTPPEARLALAANVAENSPGVPRSGLMFQASANVVSGTSDMSYNVSACHPVINRAVNDGVYELTLTGTTNVPTTLAPTTGSRWDLIFVKQNDTAKGDVDNQAIVGVVQGVESSTPAKPYASVPTGAYVLAEAQVLAGAATTNGASVTITQVWRHTVTRGAPIPVRNTTERAEITAFTGLRVVRLDQQGIVQTYRGSGWYGSMAVGGAYSVGAVVNGGSSGNIDVNFPFTFPGVPSVVITPPSGRLTGTTTLRTAADFKVVFDNKSGGNSAAGDGTYVAVYTLTS